MQMMGSLFVHTRVPEELVRLADDMDALEEFTRAEMDVMLTLDFVTVCGEHGVGWSNPQPVVFDEAAGLAIARVESAGLAWVIANRALFPEDQQADLDKLRAFVDAHGTESIYEVSVF